MAGVIFKLFLVKPTEAWYQLTSEEQADLMKKSEKSLENVGGKTLVTADCSWSSEEWMFFGVEEYPDIAAEQKHVEELLSVNFFRYVDSKVWLGSEMQQQ